MNTTGKIGWILALVFGLGAGGLAYTFILSGKTEPHADGRTVVLLLPDERNRVLGEMRALLEAVQAITQGAVAGDMAAISEAATAVGMAAAEDESPQLMGKLPIEFKLRGMTTHQAFDDLATFAETATDPLAVMGEMAEIMDNCVFCHAGYRLGIEGDDREAMN